MVAEGFAVDSLPDAVRTISWRLSTWDLDIASVRYRCVIPARHLADRGVASRLSVTPYSVLEPTLPDAVVFVKAFGDSDVEQAREAARAGVPVVADVCDNVFAPGYRAHSPEGLRRIAEVAAAVVTTGPALANVLRLELGADLPVHVVPDPVERREDVRDAARILWRQRLRQALLKRPIDLPGAVAGVLRRELVPALQRRIRPVGTADLPQVLWFGNVGSVQPRFGIVNLADIAGELEQAAREVPFRLLVVTSDRDVYRRQIEPLDLPSTFAPWDRLTIFRHLGESAVVVLPNSRDEFSVCKSANRATLALYHGVPVVATRIPSLDPLAECVLFDDFQRDLVTYLRDRELGVDHVRRAREVIEREFASAVVAERWLQCLDAAARSAISG